MNRYVLPLPPAQVEAVAAGTKTQHRLPAVRYEHGSEHALDPCPQCYPPPYKPGERLILGEAAYIEPATEATATHRDHRGRPRRVLHAGTAPADLLWSARARGVKVTGAARLPAWAARYYLELQGVALVRLQALTDADALAEGVVERWAYGGRHYGYAPADPTRPQDLLHAPVGASPREAYAFNNYEAWNANGYVWALAFHAVRTG